MSGLTQLEQLEVELAERQLTDFRAANLFALVAGQLGPGTVLDVGCGGGGLVASLLERGREARGIDTSAPIVEAARRFLSSRGLDPAAVSVQRLEDRLAAGELADNVVSMDCLEHVEDDRTFFTNLVRAVRPGGRLVLTVPALMALYGERDREIGHFRRYERDELLALTRDQPLRVDDLRYWNLLGTVPTFVYNRVLHRRIDEGFRFGRPTLRKRLLRGGLDLWFKTVEARLRPPVGLTLLLTATRLDR